MLYIPENRTDWFDGNPPGREGDIELDVLNIEGGVVGGVERDDLRVMYTYYLREFDGKWYIIGHTAWGVS